jgi:hypothetical protein
MYRATKNLFAVMNVMGHKAVSTTMKYQHQNIDRIQRAVRSRRVATRPRNSPDERVHEMGDREPPHARLML